MIHKEYKGAPAWDHERANKNFKSKSKMKEAARPSPEEREDGVQQQEHEQQSPDVASSSATDDPEQQSGVSQFAGDSCDDVSANDAPSLSKPAGEMLSGYRGSPTRLPLVGLWFQRRDAGRNHRALQLAG